MNGLDPQVVLRRWCELECTAYLNATCQDITDPSPELLSRVEQSLFRMAAPRNEACVAACDSILPALVSRDFPIHRYFAEQPGRQLGRELQSLPKDQRCGPDEKVFITEPLTQAVPAATESGIGTYFSLPSFSVSQDWLPVAPTIVLVGAVLLFGPVAALAL